MAAKSACPIRQLLLPSSTRPICLISADAGQLQSKTPPAHAKWGFSSSVMRRRTPCNPLAPPAVTVIAAAAKQKDNQKDDQNEFHRFLQNISCGPSFLGSLGVSDEAILGNYLDLD
jgi:hypothetical protein